MALRKRFVSKGAIVDLRMDPRRYCSPEDRFYRGAIMALRKSFKSKGVVMALGMDPKELL